MGKLLRKTLTKRRYDRANRGDSWIGLANKHNISLDDLLLWNGIDPTKELPVLQRGQRVIITDPYKLDTAVISDEAPKDYSDWGPGGKHKIDQWTNAWKSGQVRYEDVPEIYKIPVFQQYVKGGMSDFNAPAAAALLNGASFAMNPLGYLAAAATQKGAAYGWDALSGKNEYGLKDVFKYTPVAGREATERNPYSSMILDALVGGYGSKLLQAGYNNFTDPGVRRAIMNNAMSSAKTATGAKTPFQEGFELPVQTGVQNGGGGYQAGNIGFGKTSGTYAGRTGGYKPIMANHTTGINNFSGTNSASWKPAFARTGAIPWTPMAAPTSAGLLLYPQEPDTPNYFIPKEEKHIYERWNRNRWQNPNPTGEVGPYIPGTGSYSVEGHAPIGPTPFDQAFTEESLKTFPYRQSRVAKYVPGGIEGKPSLIYSGLGHIYDTHNPGSVIDKNIYTSKPISPEIEEAVTNTFEEMKKRFGVE